MKKYYKIDIQGVKRNLELFPIGENLQIGAFILFGDVEITIHSAKELLKLAPKFDIMLTAECKSIPLIYEMARQIDAKDYIIARKAPKLYMKNVTEVSTKSITTEKVQTLCIGEKEKEALKGKRVLIVDDVISTGESLLSMEKLCIEAGAKVVGKMAVLAEGDAKDRDDIIYLAPLPLFDKEGNPL